MPRAGLDPERVVRRASELIDERGNSRLTLAQLAGELGVATPSLYKHIDGLDDLINRVAARTTAQLADRLGKAAQGRSGRDALEALGRAYRLFARDHPETYRLVQRPVDTPEWTAAASASVAAVAAALAGYGVHEQDVDRIRFVRASLHGFVDLEHNGGFGLPASIDASFTFLLDGLDTVLRSGGPMNTEPTAQSMP